MTLWRDSGRSRGVVTAQKYYRRVSLPVSARWTPTSENIDALPPAIRRYIRDLESGCDCAADVQQKFIFRAECEMLRWECERLAAQAGKGRRSLGETVAKITAKIAIIGGVLALAIVYCR
jgi:hypothetical protein